VDSVPGTTVGSDNCWFTANQRLISSASDCNFVPAIARALIVGLLEGCNQSGRLVLGLAVA
jgi:hypothetical protein